MHRGPEVQRIADRLRYYRILQGTVVYLAVFLPHIYSIVPLRRYSTLIICAREF